MSFLLLGIDSLIVGLAIGPILDRRAVLPLAGFFGLCDGVGFVIGSAFHWQVSDSVATPVAMAVMVSLGLYWIVLAGVARRTARTGWVWILPVVMSIDNITFGLIDGHWTTSVAGQATEQALSSALLALIGLGVSIAAARTVPALQRSRILATGVAGGALLLAAPLYLLVG